MGGNIPAERVPDQEQEQNIQMADSKQIQLDGHRFIQGDAQMENEGTPMIGLCSFAVLGFS